MRKPSLAQPFKLEQKPMVLFFINASPSEKAPHI